mmetsp:Transcript_31698/g.55711  ORF Transcript_31698/g.55711 Transcript_31698/m.55711 type:complete len:221 (+) Transcript_31698:95-757(+)
MDAKDTQGSGLKDMGQKGSKKSKKEEAKKKAEAAATKNLHPSQAKSLPSGQGTGEEMKMEGEIPNRVRDCMFTMGCYWTGEGKLGCLKGVLKTVAGSSPGYFETVQVTYDPSLTSPETLQLESGFRLVTKKDGKYDGVSFRTADSSQQKYYLQNTPGLRHLIKDISKGGKVAGSHIAAAQINSLIGGYGTDEVLTSAVKRGHLNGDETARLKRLFKGRRK